MKKIIMIIILISSIYPRVHFIFYTDNRASDEIFYNENYIDFSYRFLENRDFRIAPFLRVAAVNYFNEDLRLAKNETYIGLKILSDILLFELYFMIDRDSEMRSDKYFAGRLKVEL